MPVPTDITSLRSFTGLVNFYGKFVHNLADTAEPLYALTRNDSTWKWTSRCQQAFVEIKRKITTTPTLAHFDPSIPIGISCDASSVGLGVVLFHKYSNGNERPIAFASKILSSTEKRYSQIEKEGLSIIFGIQKFYKYLCGRKFLLVTDHKPLLSIFGPKSKLPTYVATRLNHWSIYLQQFTYDVIYRKSSDHGNADALSRLPVGLEHTTAKSFESTIKQVTNELCSTLPVTSQHIRKATARDTTLSRVHEFILQGWPKQLADDQKPTLQPYYTRRSELAIVNGIVMWGSRVVIPKNLRNQILEVLHSCHTGIVRMKLVARAHVWWPGLDREIEKTGQDCIKCQVKQPDPPSAPLHPWQFPERPWQRLHMDLAGPFLNKMWLIIMDAHSKWPEVFCIQSSTTTVVTSKLEEVISRLGIPEQIVTDNGRQFISNEFESFCARYNMKNVLSSVYHPRSNGEAERFVRTFKEGMKSSDLPLSSRLANFLFAYRSTPHTTTGVTPAELLYGKRIRTLLDLVHPDVRDSVTASQTRQQATYNKKTKDREFVIGQAVWVKTFSKNEENWSWGKISSVIGPVTYMVEVGRQQLKRHADQIRGASIITTTDALGDTSGNGASIDEACGLEVGEEVDEG